MSRAFLLVLLLALPLCASATVAPPVARKARVESGVLTAAGPPAGGCQEKCVADERDCLASDPCTAGTPEEQKECKRKCEQIYAFCLAEC